MNNKSLLTTTLLAALTLSGFESNAASANTPPPARVPGLDLVKEEPRTSSNKSDKLEEDLTDGLVAHYPFSGDANDQSGNENHLSVHGASLSTDRFGMTDSAYSFDGKDDYLFADLNDRKGDFSLSLWARQTMLNRVAFVQSSISMIKHPAVRQPAKSIRAVVATPPISSFPVTRKVSR